MAHYSYYAFRLTDGLVLGDVPITGMTPSWGLNDAGASGSPSIDLRGLEPVQRADVRDATMPYQCGILVDRDSRIVWSGLITQRRYASSDSSYRLTCVGLFDYWKVRLIAATQTFAQVDQFDIVEALLTLGGPPTIPLQPMPQLSGVKRDRTISSDQLTPVQDEILQIADNVHGYELVIESRWATSTAERRVDHFVRVGSPNLLLPKGEALISLEYPGNVINYVWDEDGANLITDVYGSSSSSDGTTTIRDAHNADMLAAGYPRIERARNYSNISDTDVLDQHLAQALAEGAVYGNAPTFTVKDADDTAVGLWSVGDGFRLRVTDECRFPNLTHPHVPGLDTTVRLQSATLYPSSGTIELTMTPVLPGMVVS